MHVPAPHHSVCGPIDRVIAAARSVCGDAPVDRCLVYAPDAIGLHLCEDYASLFEEVARHALLAVELNAVFPPKTPVCFASMFTGVMPEVHGIRTYERPVLTCDTIFDALIRAGKSPAIVAAAGASVDLIFRNRAMDYFTERDDESVTLRVEELLASGSHDFILAYHSEYDDMLHLTSPRSEKAIHAAEHHVASFCRLARAVETNWSDCRRAILFTPDHGAHVDPATGKGAHGENIPEDMQVRHYFGFGCPRR